MGQQPRIVLGWQRGEQAVVHGTTEIWAQEHTQSFSTPALARPLAPFAVSPGTQGGHGGSARLTSAGHDGCCSMGSYVRQHTDTAMHTLY